MDLFYARINLKELYASLRINVQFLKYMCDRAAAILLIGAWNIINERMNEVNE